MPLVKIIETLGSTVNISGFHFAELTTDEAGKAPVYGEINHIRGAQDIKVNPSEDMIENWGDGEVQESAVSQGKTKVDLQAFAIPLETRAFLAGLEVDENGLVTKHGGVLNPPNVGAIFYKERKNKDIECVALLRGVFQVEGDQAKTADDKIEFGNQSITGEFSGRISDGIVEYRKYIKKDDYTSLDEFFTKVFGKTAPVTATPKGWKARTI
ncbi:hypothetical protein CW663_08135 [Macrococcoides caseolyticum]|uniref:major tail protein n=1 Tax=Macrococcoides caseolyticum TaxID=69966 RepID=UPI000C34F7F6|nr:major tail protein [Macrococcus caseolyticus]PKE67416.1 hypothetical protein CW663_08135 [Macrococcus caseolyticus]